MKKQSSNLVAETKEKKGRDMFCSMDRSLYRCKIRKKKGNNKQEKYNIPKSKSISFWLFGGRDRG
jgi:hypothetical protein